MATTATPRTGAIELTPYAQRFPIPKRTGDVQKDGKSELDYIACQKVVSLLQARPSLAFETLGALESKQHVDPTVEQDIFPKEVVTFGHIKSDWWASWLQRHTANALHDDMLRRIVQHDASSVERLRYFCTQVPRTVVLPPGCKVRKVCARVLDERARDVGTRLNNDWLTEHTKPNGAVCWGLGAGLLCWFFWGL